MEQNETLIDNTNQLDFEKKFNPNSTPIICINYEYNPINLEEIIDLSKYKKLKKIEIFNSGDKKLNV